MRRTLLALVAILPLEAATSQDRGVVRDSAGIQVVTHRESAVVRTRFHCRIRLPPGSVLHLRGFRFRQAGPAPAK